MDLKKCRILLDAIDCRNLSKVAKDYGYTPSGVWPYRAAVSSITRASSSTWAV